MGKSALVDITTPLEMPLPLIFERIEIELLLPQDIDAETLDFAKRGIFISYQVFNSSRHPQQAAQPLVWPRGSGKLLECRVVNRGIERNFHQKDDH